MLHLDPSRGESGDQFSVVLDGVIASIRDVERRNWEGRLEVSWTLDVDAPVLVAPSSVTIPENTLAVTTFTVSDSGEVALSLGSPAGTASGDDSALFALNTADMTLRFIESPDYEAPRDSSGTGQYQVTLVATDEAGNYSTQIISVSVDDVVVGDI